MRLCRSDYRGCDATRNTRGHRLFGLGSVIAFVLLIAACNSGISATVVDRDAGLGAIGTAASEGGIFNVASLGSTGILPNRENSAAGISSTVGSQGSAGTPNAAAGTPPAGTSTTPAGTGAKPAGTGTTPAGTSAKPTGTGTMPAGNAPPSQCPSGTKCGAPAGALVCTLSDATIPTCANQQACSFGQCQQYNGQGYCVQTCGPAAVASCAAGSQCTNPVGTYYSPQGSFFCTLPDTGLPPDCTSQTCPYGECVLYGQTTSCMQPCNAPPPAACAAGAECTVFGVNVVCVKNETGIPPTCNSKADCSFGDCIKTQGQGYCAQYCNNPVNRITGLVESYSPQSGALIPEAGVEVCAYNNAQVPCTNSLTDGSFVLRGVPQADYFVLSLKKSGYVPTLRLSYTYEVQTAVTATILYTEAQMKATANSVGATYPDAANGFITFFGTTTTDDTLSLLQDFTANLQPKSGMGPVYINSLGSLDKSLTGASAFGSGAYFNVAPATYTMTFSHPSLTCGDPVSVLVVAGYVSANVPAYCQ